MYIYTAARLEAASERRSSQHPIRPKSLHPNLFTQNSVHSNLYSTKTLFTQNPFLSKLYSPETLFTFNPTP